MLFRLFRGTDRPVSSDKSWIVMNEPLPRLADQLAPPLPSPGQGSLGSVLAAGVGACSSKACAYNNGCPAGRYAESVGATDKLCALCKSGTAGST